MYLCLHRRSLFHQYHLHFEGAFLSLILPAIIQPNQAFHSIFPYEFYPVPISSSDLCFCQFEICVLQPNALFFMGMYLGFQGRQVCCPGDVVVF